MDTALIGQRFGRLRVVSVNGSGLRGKTIAQCLCDCGTVKDVAAASLKSGNTKSCGCLSRDTAILVHTKHGESARGKTSAEYRVWAHMLDRCKNPKNARFHRYGGRGIFVCGRWHKFENFIRDVGHRPSPKHSIERRDNDGNYEPTNCYWATTIQQANNKTTNHNLTFNGTTMTVTRWASKLGIKTSTLRARVKRGWSLSTALEKPVQYHVH
jgi:hypothetical protein